MALQRFGVGPFRKHHDRNAILDGGDDDHSGSLRRATRPAIVVDIAVAAPIAELGFDNLVSPAGVRESLPSCLFHDLPGVASGGGLSHERVWPLSLVKVSPPSDRVAFTHHWKIPTAVRK